MAENTENSLGAWDLRPGDGHQVPLARTAAFRNLIPQDGRGFQPAPLPGESAGSKPPNGRFIRDLADALSDPTPVHEFLTNIWVDGLRTAADTTRDEDVAIHTGTQVLRFWVSPSQPLTYLACESNEWLGGVLRDISSIRAGVGLLDLIGRSSMKSYKATSTMPIAVGTFPGGAHGVDVWDRRQGDGTWQRPSPDVRTPRIVRWVQQPTEQEMYSEIARYWQDSDQPLNRATQLTGLPLGVAVELLHLPPLDKKDTGDKLIISCDEALALAASSQAEGYWPSPA